MEVSSVGSLSTALSQSQVGDAVAITMLKKAMDLQAQTAAQLLQALPAPSNPPHLGNSVDIKV